MSVLRNSVLVLLVLGGCGRETFDADAKLVGVGLDPDEIGLPPTPYGGTIEYAHIDFAGAGLPLGLLGFSSFDPVGPQMNRFAPPYEAVVGFGYVFDTPTRISSFSSITPDGPTLPDTCVTLFTPQGPLGQFTTVDVGAHMTLLNEDGTEGLHVTRNPAQYPPDASDVRVSYFSFETYRPRPRTRMSLSPDAPDDPAAMVPKTYQRANYPFGQKVTWGFPGGFTHEEQPVGSIPLPSAAGPVNELWLPDPMGGVALSWNGPHYDSSGSVTGAGPQVRCLEFYEGREEAAEGPRDCDELAATPTDESYNQFRGQMYTAPWDTVDQRLTLQWTPWKAPTTGAVPPDQVLLMIRFLERIQDDRAALKVPAVRMSDGRYRPAQECEEGDAELVTSDQLAGVDEPQYIGLQGDPTTRLAEVVCTLADDGEFVIGPEVYGRALAYAREQDAGGVIFSLTRKRQVDAEVLPVKDPYDQRRDINPVKLSASTTRLGRFWWGSPNEGE